MASPKLEVFFLYNASTGAPLTGATPAFTTYKDETGTNVTQPSISELAGGAYAFTPSFPSASHGIFYVVDGGATAAPRYAGRYMRPEDWNGDGVPAIQTDTTTLKADTTTLKADTTTLKADTTTLKSGQTALQTDVTTVKGDTALLRKYGEGRWKVHTTGADSGKLVLYDPTDNTTVLLKFALKNAAGASTITDPYERMPTS